MDPNEQFVVGLRRGHGPLFHTSSQGAGKFHYPAKISGIHRRAAADGGDLTEVFETLTQLGDSLYLSLRRWNYDWICNVSGRQCGSISGAASENCRAAVAPRAPKPIAERQ